MDYMKNLLSSKGASKNLMILAIGIVGILVIASVSYTNGFFGNNPNQNQSQNENILSSDEISEKVINFINENVLQEQATASLIEIVEENGLYKVKIKIGEEEFDSYVTTDGKLLFPQVIDMEEREIQGETQKEIPKKDNSELKVFVFSYCPYSLQYEKGLLPVVDLLFGKANIKIISIGAMHGEHEEIESKRQNCIREEQSDKYWTYIKCFIYSEGIKECSSKFYNEFNGDDIKMAKCLESYLNECFDKIKIDKAKLKDCMENRSDDYYKSDMQLAEEYGISSSPMIMVNEVIFDKSFCDSLPEICNRSSEAIKKSICEGFISKPSECSQNLSEDVFSPGFGEGTASSGSGQCR